MLLTRSRLCPEPKLGSSLHLHVLSTPPAFVLSQDQTLREELLTKSAAVSLEGASYTTRRDTADGISGCQRTRGSLAVEPRRHSTSGKPAVGVHAVEFSKTAALPAPKGAPSSERHSSPKSIERDKGI